MLYYTERQWELLTWIQNGTIVRHTPSLTRAEQAFTVHYAMQFTQQIKEGSAPRYKGRPVFIPEYDVPFDAWEGIAFYGASVP